ncbi:DNA-binding response regulator PetR [Liberibacter crescens BT-1]|uniref:DNA-binding response regulator PetR n=1 Tax=Liberibacter crescens (strain BT-1) TaxID=1215343 RepID=L0ETE6_LIBCB|nr:response regulator transcription factor [Liberibacter crescens]AGA64814.1 DNA-binding response regulator PetR [Liberibacter crescens BT-1]AMC12872.1 chemotaxis protein CheY [Liberibacter crescens]
MIKKVIPISDESPHLLIVDDDSRIRVLLNRYLNENGFRSTVVANAAEARQHLEWFQFDLIILDIMMPHESGLSLTKSLRVDNPVPVILLTALDETHSRISGLETGADDYLSKPFDPRELILRIKNILKRHPANSDEQKIEKVMFGPYTFFINQRELRKGNEIIRLTEREENLMMLFCIRAGDTIPRQELITGDMERGERSIDVQINRLRRKIEICPTKPIYLKTVRGIGYRLNVN